MNAILEFVISSIRHLYQFCQQNGGRIISIYREVQQITFGSKQNKEIQNNGCKIEDSNEVDMPHSLSEDQGSQGAQLKKHVNIGDEMLNRNNVSNENAETLEGCEHSEDQMQNMSETVPEEKVSKRKSPLELFACLVNERLKDEKFKGTKEDGLKVFIRHTEQDTVLAKCLSKYLREKKRFRAFSQDDINAELRVNIDLLKAAINWADVVVPVISNKFLEECNNIAVEDRPNESLNTIYLNILSRSIFVSKASLNYQLVPVVRKGTENSYKEHPELREAIDISDSPLDGELKNIGDKIIACADTGISVRKFMDNR